MQLQCAEHDAGLMEPVVVRGLRDCIESMTLEWVDPIEGASKLAPTNPQEPPADASPVMQRYVERMPPMWPSGGVTCAPSVAAAQADEPDRSAGRGLVAVVETVGETSLSAADAGSICATVRD